MFVEKKPHQLSSKKFSIGCEQIHMNLRAVLVRVLWPMAITDIQEGQREWVSNSFFYFSPHCSLSSDVL